MQTTSNSQGPRRTRATLTRLALAALLSAGVATHAAARQRETTPAKRRATAQTPVGVAADKLLRIVRAEDERRWEASDLGQLLADPAPAVRGRAAVAAGRIGDVGAVAPLARLLGEDSEESVRAAAAFALGEIESDAGADALLAALRTEKAAEVRARIVEAVGKIAAALGEAQAERRNQLGAAVVGLLAAEHRRPQPHRLTVLLGLTAALRARPAEGPQTVALFLDSPDGRVRADAANTLTRLRAKVALERLRAMLTGDSDPVARANAARALGAAEDAAATDALLKAATADADQRVRISALRSLAQLRAERAADPLVRRAEALRVAVLKGQPAPGVIAPTNEVLEVFTALGRLLANTTHERATELLRAYRTGGLVAPELEVALARIAPGIYVRDPEVAGLNRRGPGSDTLAYARRVSAVAQGLGELAALAGAADGGAGAGLQADAQKLLRVLLDDQRTPPLAVPDLLRALAAFRPPDLGALARARLTADDVIVRATAAELLGELPPSEENAAALVSALARALRDEQLNDAALSTLGALARQRDERAAAAIRTALASTDYLVRRRAAELLREGAGDMEAARRAATVNTRHRPADYARALGRVGKTVRAVVRTDRGSFTIELLPEDAPLTVDNFVRLARSDYFNNVSFHRVVPNFVIQGGDPRGDGNGGPGYQIRCEINTVPYERGAVGMALSGKDTGGSQWFVTHSPQPHLDGGYTVFGRVVAGQDVVDRITRGDLIRAIVVTETPRRK